MKKTRYPPVVKHAIRSNPEPEDGIGPHVAQVAFASNGPLTVLYVYWNE